MRAIKFRAWDERRNRMIEVTSINFRNGTIEEDTRYAVNRELYFDQIKLMQSTGLKDKKGVEIYEGDIVKWSRLCMDFNLENYEERSDNFVVEWDVYNTGFVLGDGEVFLYKDISADLEVIGNIFEDIELLGEQNK